MSFRKPVSNPPPSDEQLLTKMADDTSAVDRAPLPRVPQVAVIEGGPQAPQSKAAPAEGDLSMIDVFRAAEQKTDRQTVVESGTGQAN